MNRKSIIVATALIFLNASACGISLQEKSGKDNLSWNQEIENEKENNLSDKDIPEDIITSESEENQEQATEYIATETIEEPIIKAEGTTLSERIGVPTGYHRTDESPDSLATFLRNYSLKPSGSNVLLYDGSEKRNQNAHVAVFDLPIENYDLQQCADSVMRVYAEYYWSMGAYDKIAFHFTNGFLAEYSRWRDGYRIKVDGNQVKWVNPTGRDESYECFVQYLKMVFNYAGTLSMESEAEKIGVSDMRVGDVFLYGGSPGHVVMIVDICENENGEKGILLGQGYMPAQEFHLLKNPLHEEDPWYYEEEITFPFYTPEYTFSEGTLKRLSY